MIEKVVLWGAGNVGKMAYEDFSKGEGEVYEVKACGDNDQYKQGLIYNGVPIVSFEELVRGYSACKVIISMEDYYEEAKKMSERGIQVLGYYDVMQKKVLPWEKITWESLDRKKRVRLYAGDIYECFDQYPDDYVICLSLTNANYRTLKHDITEPYPLPSDSIESYQIEDVLEHIEKEEAVKVLDEIYRILKKDGYLRLSLPDYHLPVLLHSSFINSNGEPVFDLNGGGRYVRGKVCEGGHVWFPTYEMVNEILEKSAFQKYEFYRYCDSNGKKFAKEIDYDKGYIYRTKENAIYEEDHSIVVDCYKVKWLKWIMRGIWTRFTLGVWRALLIKMECCGYQMHSSTDCFVWT